MAAELDAMVKSLTTDLTIFAGCCSSSIVLLVVAVYKIQNTNVSVCSAYKIILNVSSVVGEVVVGSSTFRLPNSKTP